MFFFLTERMYQAQLENDFKRQKILKQVKMKTAAIEYFHGSATRLAQGKTPNSRSVWGVSVLEPEDRHGLVLEGEIAEGGSHCSDSVASEHKQIPVFATTIVE